MQIKVTLINPVSECPSFQKIMMGISYEPLFLGHTKKFRIPKYSEELFEALDKCPDTFDVIKQELPDHQYKPL